MTLEEAKQIILNERDNPLSYRLVRATVVLGASEHKDKVSVDELLDCLRLGHIGNKPTIVAEYAALALYTRTGRKRSSEVPFADFTTDPKDWAAYLDAHP